jgi:hypothetical protein
MKGYQTSACCASPEASCYCAVCDIRSVCVQSVYALRAESDLRAYKTCHRREPAGSC